MSKISRLQFITTNAVEAEQACKGGVDWIQLRLKNVPYDEYYVVGKAVQAVCKQYHATFIINDNIQLALAIGADGIHVGKQDPLPQEDVEKMLARNGIIGCTANTIEDFEHLAGKPISYIGLGPFRFTTTKQNLSPILGIEGYEKIIGQLKEKAIPCPPIIAIGGITKNDIPELMATGIHGIAVSGAIARATDKQTAAETLKMVVQPTNQVFSTSLILNAPPEAVWDALTNPLTLKLWWTDAEMNIESNWHQGAEMTFNGKWQNMRFTDRGTILNIVPQQALEYNYWSSLSKLSDKPGHRLVIRFQITPTGQLTTLTLTQRNFILETNYKHWKHHWNLALHRLKQLTEKNEQND